MTNNYRQITTVNHQGTVIAFARGLASTDIYYNVLDLKVTTLPDGAEWTGFNKLDFPSELRPAGLGIITLEDIKGKVLRPAEEPFFVISEGQYVCIFQQSERHTLLLTRFMLKRVAPAQGAAPVPILEPIWEVRFQRSGKQDIPGGKIDSQSYLSPAGPPFIEPNIELSMIKNLDNGRFSVVILPSESGEKRTWQFFAVDSDSKTLNLFSFPMDDNGLFDLSTSKLDAKGNIPPNVALTLKFDNQGTPENVSISGAPSSSLYTLNERVHANDSDSLVLKRVARLFVTVPVERSNNGLGVATLDFGISKEGALASIDQETIVSIIDPADYALKFSNSAYLRTPSNDGSLSLRGSFHTAFWLQVDGPVPTDEYIFQGDSGSEPKDAAPYIKVTNELKIEIGFGNGSEAVASRTQTAVVKPLQWVYVEAAYNTEKQSGNFSIAINGNAVPMDGTVNSTLPAGAPITTISGAGNGIVGAIDYLKIWDDASDTSTLVADWEFNDVDYAQMPPTTPDKSTYHNDAAVYGATLVPASTPVRNDSQGTMQIDPTGLTVYGGLLSFADPQGSPSLLTGSDGLLHMYFQGKDDAFSVTHLDAEITRAVFEAQWTAVAGADSQTGMLQLIAACSGTYMNASSIKIQPTSAAELCEIVIDNWVGRIETWKGVPRNMQGFAEVINGESTSNLNNIQFRANGITFYDNHGIYAMSRIPVDDKVPASIIFMSRYASVIQLESAEINVTSDTSSASLKFYVPQWGTDLSIVNQTWVGLPLYARDLLTVLGGTKQNYNYSPVDSADISIYQLLAFDAAGGRHVPLLFARSDVKDLTIEINDGSSRDVCNVSLDFVSADGSKHYAENDLPRNQVEISEWLQSSELAQYLLMITDAMPAALANRSSGTPPQADLRAWSKILFAFSDLPLTVGATVKTSGPIKAVILQGSTYTQEGISHALNGPSTLFRVSAQELPSNGGLPLVEDTSIFTNGMANLVTAAANGGWLKDPPHKAIEVNGKNAIKVDPSAPTADVLALPGDVSLEAWCKPNIAAGTSTNQPRLLSYRRQGSPQMPDELIEYSLGLLPAPCAAFGDSTAINGSYNLSATDCSMQIWICPQGSAGGQVLQIATIGVVKPYVTLSVDDGGYIIATYADGVAKVTSTKRVTKGEWTQLTTTLSKDTGSQKIRLDLYVNGKLEGSAEADQQSFSNTIGTFSAGKTDGCYEMWANGILMWCRALDAEQVAQSYEQTIPVNAYGLVITWYLIEGIGDKIINQALEGSPFTSQIINQPSDNPWPERGVYFAPFATNRAFGLMGQGTPLLGGWSFVSSSYRSAYAIHLKGDDYGNCGHDSSLNFDTSFSIEAWIEINRNGIVQTFISKPGNYELSVNYDNTVVFTVWTSDGVKELKSNIKIEPSKAYYISATGNTSSKQPSGDPNKQVSTTYVLTLCLYINGQVVASLYKDDYSNSVNISTSKENLNFGRKPAGAAYFFGFLSDVRLWNVVLSPETIAKTYATHLPSNGNGLVSYWRFSEMAGKVAFDQNNINNAILTSNELWSIFSPASALSLVVNGIAQDSKVIDPESIGGYGIEQLTIGALDVGNPTIAQPFYGQISEVRIWSIQLTTEQIAENMFRKLTGAETGLAGYWPCTAGSGVVAEDATGHGNTGVFVPDGDLPAWVASAVPVSNESEVVFNVLGGIYTPFVEQINGMPSVVEYADTRRDAYGVLYSVMKRCYASTLDDTANLVAGFTVGDLDTVYAGQVQTQPSLIGYIEGAPPIPSENQTNPWWSTVNYINSYADNTNIRLNQSRNATRVFTGREKCGNGSSVEYKAGVYLATSSELSFGLGEEVGWETWHLDGKLGYAGEDKKDRTSEQEVEFGYGKNAHLSDELAAAGEWEPAWNVLNPEVGRRYIPENLGYALVKSLTADMYLIKLKGSNVVVKMTLVPNTDIPQDINIINFPIDPSYVKNGTLDGRVGFKNDPAYPYADVQPGSYFKPLEAYNLKRATERQDQQLEAYYQQFSTSNYSQGATIEVHNGSLSITNGFQRFREHELAGDKSYDWRAQLAKRNICNTYVWTAGGGLHAEQSELVDTYAESYTGVTEYESSSGVEFEFAAAFVAGLYIECDALFSSSIEITSIKSSETEASFGIEVEFEPDRFLKCPLLDGQGVPIGYTEDDAPGKVDGYRFMSFFVAPSEDNFLEFQRVVDQNWLQNSGDPSAAALLEATSTANGSWRVLHRVTYVSRVPPPLQPSPAQTLPEPLKPPANLASNTVIVRMVEGQIPGEDPTPAEIGTAIAAVLGTSASSPGLLADVLPWWVDFLASAGDTRSVAYAELASLRSDLLGYMVQTYASQAQLHMSSVARVRSLIH